MAYFLNNINIENQFIKTTKEKYFVDKSNFINKINTLIGTASQFICITRPRRFGKSLNAIMLASYYSKNIDTKEIFDKLNISKSDSYLEHLNKHNVIYMKLDELPKKDCTYDEFLNNIIDGLIDDLNENYPDIQLKNVTPLSRAFTQVFSTTGEGFIFIIDEWDYIFSHNLFTETEREHFLKFFNDLLKDRSYVELAYMTGVLPIAKYSSSSSLNMFREYNFLNDNTYGAYFGFTTEEVKRLCDKQDKISLNELKEWYDGYRTLNGEEIYNPRSVVYALSEGVCQSYWTGTGPMDEISYYIETDVNEIKEDVVKMVADIPVEILLLGYGTEKVSLETKEDIYAAMCVYGFLNYYDETVRIPNKEIKLKFDMALKSKSMGDVAQVISQSRDMINATINKDIDTMIRIIQEVHNVNIPFIHYNNENSLACVIILAYISARSKYNIVREEKAGKGFADFIFYPHKITDPAFIIELKVNKTPQDAIDQIFDKKYTDKLKNYQGVKLAIGISYDTKTKDHDILIKDIE